MKKIFIFLLLVIFLIFFGKSFLINKEKEEDLITPVKKIEEKVKKIEEKTSENKIKKEIKEKKSIFVPQWQLGYLNQPNQLNQYERLIYFGEDEGMGNFISKVGNISRNPTLWFTYKIDEIPRQNDWENIAEKKIKVLKEFSLEGIVLDLEVSGIPSEKLVSEINSFVEYFLNKVKKAGFKNAVAIYGDTFYRKRPYDIQFINQFADEVMIMAYDFSKSYGEPGPNFPYEGKQKYNYDFKTMIDDFLKFIPAEKLTLIFGMYGYDWQVDEKKRPISPAKALTLNQIKEKFLNLKTMSSSQLSDKEAAFFEADVSKSGKEELVGCKLKNCLVKRDDLSKEVEINYVISSELPDEQGIYKLNYHILWFEDEKSVEIKTRYLKEKGIENIAYWAADYF